VRTGSCSLDATIPPSLLLSASFEPFCCCWRPPAPSGCSTAVSEEEPPVKRERKAAAASAAAAACLPPSLRPTGAASESFDKYCKVHVRGQGGGVSVMMDKRA
ncbi:hypothetical protein Vretifemale_5140, partial [Volvox reticuliferus]